MSFSIPGRGGFGNALRHSAPLCVRRLLMVSPGSKSSLFCIACSFLLLLWCLELEPAIHSVKQREDHLMCMWLCLIKLMGGDEWRGSDPWEAELWKKTPRSLSQNRSATFRVTDSTEKLIGDLLWTHGARMQLFARRIRWIIKRSHRGDAAFLISKGTSVRVCSFEDDTVVPARHLTGGAFHCCK